MKSEQFSITKITKLIIYIYIVYLCKINVPLLVVELKNIYCNVKHMIQQPNLGKCLEKNMIYIKGCMHPNVHCNTIYDRQDMEAI